MDNIKKVQEANMERVFSGFYEKHFENAIKHIKDLKGDYTDEQKTEAILNMTAISYMESVVNRLYEFSRFYKHEAMISTLKGCVGAIERLYEENSDLIERIKNDL